MQVTYRNMKLAIVVSEIALDRAFYSCIVYSNLSQSTHFSTDYHTHAVAAQYISYHYSELAFFSLRGICTHIIFSIIST